MDRLKRSLMLPVIVVFALLIVALRFSWQQPATPEGNFAQVDPKPIVRSCYCDLYSSEPQWIIEFDKDGKQYGDWIYPHYSPCEGEWPICGTCTGYGWDSGTKRWVEKTKECTNIKPPPVLS